MAKRISFSRFPVVSLGAEYLVMGHLMRRNILAYKAPPNNEGYDLLCIHPTPSLCSRQLRVQVKSRLATDCDHGFPVRAGTLGAFDFLIVAFLNVGYFFRKAKAGADPREGKNVPEFYTFPAKWIKKHLQVGGSWERVQLRGLNIKRYEGEAGFEQLADSLDITYPAKLRGGA